MFVLEQKVLHIVKEPKLKNRTHQTYRWEQMAICEDEKPLQEYVDQQGTPQNFRVVPLAF